MSTTSRLMQRPADGMAGNHGRLAGQHQPDARDQPWRDTGRIWRAMMLAPTLEVVEVLLRAEAVPLDRLDREWVARFGRRRP
jgi:hypothetical protein